MRQPKNRRPKKLSLGEEYVVWYNYKNKMICKFIQPTKSGFNFLNLVTNKCILKNHLYPSKCENHLSGDWFWIDKLMYIDKIKNMKFQEEVKKWSIACFGEKISNDSIERNHRFLEEAIELVQACDCTQSEAHQLVDYVFNRPIGEKKQEVGGVMVTLAALCNSQEIDMDSEGLTELYRVWEKIEAIREKQRNKPKHSPLSQLN